MEDKPELRFPPDSRQEKAIGAAYDFASIVKSDVDPMLLQDLNVKVCRSLTVATAKMLESIGHQPVIKVKKHKAGGVYHYWLEDPQIGVVFDYSPMAHRVGFVENGLIFSDHLQNILEREILVLPINSFEYEVLSGVGEVEIREHGRTAADLKNSTQVAWSQVDLGQMPDSIREKLEVLR